VENSVWKRHERLKNDCKVPCVPQHEEIIGAKFESRRYVEASCQLHVLVALTSRESPYFLWVSRPLVIAWGSNAAGHEEKPVPIPGIEP
jgi:hypothetical protein